MSDARSTVSATRGWVWVFVGGTAAGLLATYPAIGDGLWWLFATVVGWLWGLPHVAAVVVSVAVIASVVAGAVLGVRAWKDRAL